MNFYGFADDREAAPGFVPVPFRLAAFVDSRMTPMPLLRNIAAAIPMADAKHLRRPYTMYPRAKHSRGHLWV